MVIGPRPTVPSQVARYSERQRGRLAVKPGLTGWAAIKGSRGPVDTPESVRLRVALDVEYIERQSLWLDLYIIAMTIPCLLGDRSAVR